MSFRKTFLLVLFSIVAMAASSHAQSLAYMPGAYHSANYSAMAIYKVELANMSWSSGYTAPPAYNNYTYVAPAQLEVGQSYNLKVTRASYSSIRRHAFIDWNNDGDFNDADEKIAEDTNTNTILVWDMPFTVPAGVAPGPKRMRVRLHYYYYTEGTYASYYTPIYYTLYGETEDYTVEVIQPPLPELSGGALGSTYENVGFESTVTATTGTAPYTYSINRLSNADWVNIDGATGRVFGAPGSGSGGSTAVFEIVATDANSLSGMANYTVEILAPLALPYSDDMNGSKVGNYVTKLGAKSDLTLAPVSGASGLAMVASGDVNGPWVLSPGSNSANLAILDNPSLWNGGGSPNPAAWSGESMYVVAALQTQRLAAQFDYSIVNQSVLADKEYFANFVVEYTENSKDWLRAKGTYTNNYNFFRTATSGFQRETVYMDLSGNQEQVAIRFRWLVRNPWNITEATYVAVDNLETFVPVHFIGSSILTPAQETVPYAGHALTTFGGTAPVTVTMESANSALNLSVENINGTWTLTTPSNLGPSVGTAGIKNVSVKATDALGRFRVETFSLSVAPAPSPLKIDTTSLLSTTGMSNYSAQVLVSGGVPIVGTQDYIFELTSSSASWLAIDAASGVISGSVPESDIGITHIIQVKVTDRIGTMRTANYEIAVVEHMMLASNSYAPGVESFSYHEALEVMGGSAPYTWEYIGGAKPIGMNLNQSTGNLTGVPYIGQIGTFQFQIRVRDAGTQSLEATVSIDIAARTTSTLQIVTPTSSFEDGSENGSFDTVLAAGGGTPPYAWSLLSNSLPTGLSLTPDGSIIGTPVAGSAGRYTLKVRIIDALGASTVQNFTFDIAPEYFAPQISTNVDLGVIGEGTTIVKLLEVKDGTAPYTWNLVSGSLPTGVSLNTAGGSLIGTAQANTGSELGMTYSFMLRVTDAENNSDERSFNLTVTNDPANQFQVDVSSALPNAQVGSGHFSALLIAKNGVAPFTWTLISGALPAGVELGAFGGLFGEPANGQSGSFAFTVRVQDAIGNSAQQVMTLNVLPAGVVDPNEGFVATDGLANLPTASSAQGGCALGSGSSTLLLLVLMMLTGVALRRRRSA